VVAVLPDRSAESATLSCPGSVLVSVTGSRDLNVDAIALASFDLNFYPQLVRNGTETPTALQPLRRWTETPQIYLCTILDAGKSLDASDNWKSASRSKATVYSQMSITPKAVQIHTDARGFFI
jgi:hypothetical protein